MQLEKESQQKLERCRTDEDLKEALIEAADTRSHDIRKSILGRGEGDKMKLDYKNLFLGVLIGIIISGLFYLTLASQSQEAETDINPQDNIINEEQPMTHYHSFQFPATQVQAEKGISGEFCLESTKNKTLVESQISKNHRDDYERCEIEEVYLLSEYLQKDYRYLVTCLCYYTPDI